MYEQERAIGEGRTDIDFRCHVQGELPGHPEHEGGGYLPHVAGIHG